MIKDIFVTCRVNGSSIRFLVDTGSVVSILGKRMLSRVGGDIRLSPTSQLLFLADESALDVYGEIDATLEVSGGILPQKFIVADIHEDGLLGMDFLSRYKCCIDIKKQLLFMEGNTTGLPLEMSVREEVRCRAVISKNTHIPAWSEMLVPISVVHNGRWDGIGWVEAMPKFTRQYPLLVAHSLFDLTQGTSVIRVCNVSDEDQVLHHGTEAVFCYPGTLVSEAGEGHHVNQVHATTSNTPVRLDDSVEKLFMEGSKHLELSEKEQLRALLVKYRDRFSDGKGDFGRTSEVKHTIYTGESRPIKLAPRRIPIHLRDEADKIVDDMIGQGVIEPSSSPWGAPTVLVKKKDGTLRYCVDYRKLNEVTKKDAYPLPRIDDTFDSLSGAKWFSTLDLCSGYWQVEMDESDKEKTAFYTRRGLYQFKVMPFGLCNAPATFERLMERVMQGLQWETLLIYLDDIIIFSSSVSEGLRRFEEVLIRLRTANLKLKSKKCHLFQQEVNYLGHVVSAEGIGTDPDKITAVKSWMTPKCATEVRSFLGLCAYYRRFIKEFSRIAKPLHRLTEKGRAFLWDDNCQEAFEGLKQSLTSAPILIYPVPGESFILDTDASDLAIGAVLSQMVGGVEKVIAYGSKTLSKSERNYCVTRRELLAVVGFTKYFRHYLLGRKFLLRTDHNSLRWLRAFKDPDGQVSRWTEKLADYDFDIVHRPGKLHGNADGLSRMACKQCGIGTSSEVRNIGERSPRNPWIVGIKDEVIRREQRTDGKLGRVIEILESGVGSLEEIAIEDKTVRYYLLQKDTLVLENGVLLKLWEKEQGLIIKKIVLPKTLHESILKSIHNENTGGHLGEKKTYLKVKDRFYWSGMKATVEMYCRSCVQCSRHAPSTTKAPLQKYLVGFPMQRVAMDLTGPLPLTHRRNRYVLVCMDYFSKWVETYALPNIEAKTVARAFVEEFCCRFGLPEEIHSDQGSQFQSALFTQMCCMFGIGKTRTTAYHPQSDGMVERFNRTLKNMLSKLVNAKQNDWDEHLSMVTMAYRSSVHQSTGFTPSQLMFSREMILPIDLLYGRPKDEITCVSEEYVLALQGRVEVTRNLVRENLKSNFLKQKTYFDRKCKQCEFRSGDRVWVRKEIHKPGISHKLDAKWNGPFTVVKKLSGVLFRISQPGKVKTLVVHANRLRKQSHSLQRESLDRVNHGNSRSAGRGPESHPPKSQHAAGMDSDISEELVGTTMAMTSKVRGHRFGDFRHKRKSSEAQLRICAGLRPRIETEVDHDALSVMMDADGGGNTKFRSVQFLDEDEIVEIPRQRAEITLPNRGPYELRPRGSLRPPRRFIDDA